MAVQSGEGIWRRLAVILLPWGLSLVPLGEGLADFCMGPVLGLREDQIKVDSSRDTHCGKDKEAVGVQASLWGGRDRNSQ